MEQVLNNDEEAKGYDCDIESEAESSFEEVSAKKKKRGRPRGTKRKYTSDDQESAESGDDAGRTKRKHNKSVVIPTLGLLAVLCCSQLCFGKIPQVQIDILRDSIAHLNKIELSQWVLDWLWTNQRPDDQNCYLIGEWRVCLAAFLAAIGMPLSTFYAVRRRFKCGQKKIQGPGSIAGKMSCKAQNALSWILDYAYNYAEKMPEDGKLFLPSCLTKRAVYGHYKQDMQDKKEDTTSESHFYWIWRNCLRHITIPAVSRMSKCTRCTELKTELSQLLDKNSRKEKMEERQEHLLEQSLERRKYYKHATKARRDPTKYLSLILDGMDQSKTEIPHSVYRSTLTSSMWKLRTHLVGVIAHGCGIYGFFDHFQYPHGSNLTIHVLMRVLYDLKDSLPDVLYLQMDNCGRENKNKFILGFLCLLVELGIFIKIKLSFLVVGHTHEDIDQVFSRFSTWLKKHSATTIPKLLEGFRKCYTPAPQSFETKEAFDVTGWIEEHIAPISDHSRPHVFKICRDDEGKARIHWKDLTTDKEWTPTTGTHKYLLKSRPSAEPPLMEISTDKINVEQLKTDLRKYFSHFPCEADRTWWSGFLDSLESDDQDELAHDGALWLLPEIIKAKEKLSHHHGVMSIEGYIDQSFTSQEQSCLEETSAPKVSRVSKKDQRKTNVVIGRPDKIPTPGPVPIKKPLTAGDMALVYLASYAGEWPQVGRIESLDGDNCIIHWFKGCMTGSWSPCTRPARGEKGKRSLWLEEIPISSVWLYGFPLTPAGKLNQKTKDQIEDFNDF